MVFPENSRKSDAAHLPHDMADYTQSRRPMMVSTPLGANKLLLVGFEGTEEVSKLFTFRLDLLATNGMPVQFEKLLGQPMLVSVRIVNEGSDSAAKYRYFSGICSRFSQGNRDNDFTEYQAEMVPHLWLLTRRSQSRIFQQMTVPEILKKVLHGIKVADEIDGHFEKRDYCVQYRETDFAFVSRLMEEEGIFYFFRHTKDAHELVIGNSPRTHVPVLGEHTARWHNVDGGDREGNHIHQWQKHQEVRSGKVTLWDHSFELPGDNLHAMKSTLGSVKVGKVTQKLAVADNEQLEIYDYPGEYAKRFDGTDRDGGPTPAEIRKIFEDNRRTAEIRMQAETVAGLAIRGTSNCRHFTTGHHFMLDRHFNAEGQYVLTSVTHSAKLGNAYRSGGKETFDYTNTFSCIPNDLPFRPQRTIPKPLITGVQTATVVGPKGKELFVDKHARVKVQFPWDREGKHDNNSSCWIRVSQPWAGGTYGGLIFPRIGQEVIVDFVEGDPDRPLIIGRVYNAGSMPPPSNAGREDSDVRRSRDKATAKKQNAADIKKQRANRKQQNTASAPSAKTAPVAVPNSPSILAGAEERMPPKKDNPFNKFSTSVVDTVMMSSLKSSSLDGKTGTNEITMNDAGGSEGLFVKAQKDNINAIGNDRETTIGKDDMETIGHDRVKTIGNDETNEIGHDRMETVGNDETIEIGHDRHETVGQNEDIEIGNDRTEQVGNDEKITIGHDRIEKVGGDEHIEITGNRTETVGKDESTEIAGKEDHTVAEGITIKCKSTTTIADKFNHLVTDDLYITAVKQILADGAKLIQFRSPDEGGAIISITPTRIELKVGASLLAVDKNGIFIGIGGSRAFFTKSGVRIDGAQIDLNP